jgi:ubiquinone/menaquinone biosynthesis C-methylase UbiE
VDDLDAAIAEIKRIVAPGGLFLLLTDVNHEPTPCEPTCYSWDIVERFRPEMDLLKEQRYERVESGIYDSIDADVPYDHSKEDRRPGVLSAKFAKKA